MHLELELGIHDVGEIVEQHEHCSDPRKCWRDLADHIPPINHSAGNHHCRCRRGRRRPCRKFFGSRVKRFIGDVALVMGPVIGRERLYKSPSGFESPLAKGNTTLSLSHIRRARSFEPFYLLECSTRSCVRRSVLACSSGAQARFDLVPPSCLHAHLRCWCSVTIPGIQGNSGPASGAGGLPQNENGGHEEKSGGTGRTCAYAAQAGGYFGDMN